MRCHLIKLNKYLLDFLLNLFCFSQVEKYANLLEPILIKKDDGIKLMPELYAVPLDKVSSAAFFFSQLRTFSLLT